MRLFKRAVLGVFVLAFVAVAGGLGYLATVDFNVYRDVIAEQAELATGRKLAILGDIDVKLLSLTPTAIVRDVSFANAPWGSANEMIGLDRLELKIDLLPLLAGRLSIGRLVLIAPDILLETDRKGRGNWLFDAAGPSQTAGRDAGAAADLPAVRSLRIEDARITYRDGRTGQKTTVTLGRVTLRADDADSPLQVRATGTLNGTKVTVAGEMGPIAELLAGGAYPADLEIRLGGSDVSGKIELALTAVPPKITGTLSARVLDIDELSGAADGTEPGASKSDTEKADAPTADAPKAGAPKADRRLFPDTALPLEALKSLDADLRLKVARLVAGGAEIANVDLELALAGGRLELKPLAGEVAGGSVAGAIVVDARRPEARLAVDLKLRRIALGPLTQQIFGSEIMRAPLNADIELGGRGRSVRAIAASLGGRITAITGQGRFDDTLLSLLSSDLLNAITPGAQEKRLGLTCLVADFVVAKGVARRRVLLVDTTRAAIVGRKGGTVDLGRERVDLLLDPHTKAVSVASVVAAPIRVEGPLASPSVYPDPAETLKSAVLAPLNLVENAGGVLDALGNVAGSVGSVIGLGGDAKKSQAASSRCPEALAAVEAGRPWPGGASAASGAVDADRADQADQPEESGGVRKALEDVGEGVGDALKGIGRGIGNIFK
jgi:uncharacterized protein involved in outer membrane biogenesis